MTEIRISIPAKESFEDLPPDVQDRLKSKLYGEVAENPARYLKPLENSPHDRVRVGDYRVILEWDRDVDMLKVHKIGHRRNVYDDY